MKPWPRSEERKTIWCEEGKHGECKGWGETIFRVPRERVECACDCHPPTEEERK